MVYLESEDRRQFLAALGQCDPGQAIVCFSIDDFDGFRRRFGFELGDQVLSHLESVARDVLAPTLLTKTPDSLFVGVLPSTTPEAMEQTDRLRTRISGSKLRFTVDGASVAHFVTISAGISPIVRHAPAWTLESASKAWADARQSSDTVVEYEERDPLTGLLTGSSLDRQLEQGIGASTPESPFTLLSWDLDAFQKLNREVGSEAADGVLRRVADRLAAMFGEVGFVARPWADEFLVGLPDKRAEDAAFEAESLRRELAEKSISVSIGLATAPLHGQDVQEIVRRAREARYVSQISGGACVSVAEPDQMVTKTSHFSKTQLQRLSKLAKAQDRSEAAFLREGLDGILQVYEDSAHHPMGSRSH